MRVMTTPNMISAGRIVASPIMGLAGRLEHPRLFLVLFAACLLSDFVDGLLARMRSQKSKLGARLDTWGDVSMYLCAVFGAAFLWPNLIVREGSFIAVAILLIAVSGTVSLLKHGRLPTYHTWSAKLSTAVIGITALLMFSGVSAWPFRLSVAALAVSAVEETGITIILPRWRPDVRTVFHAVRLKRQERKSAADGNREARAP
jgi:CDP-diacylglycerol--glycerol-3-phosphate 3-phosphatidyltransferase